MEGCSSREAHSAKETVSDWIASAQPAFSEPMLVYALKAQMRSAGAVSLSEADRQFWDRHSGVNATPDAVAEASADNAAARIVIDMTSLTAADVAHRLGLSPSTVRRYKSARRLYSYKSGGRRLFPAWQFRDGGNRRIPALERVLEEIPASAHPQTVAGFFMTSQPDLEVKGNPVSPKEWLETGGPVEPVAEMARGL